MAKKTTAEKATETLVVTPTVDAPATEVAAAQTTETKETKVRKPTLATVLKGLGMKHIPSLVRDKKADKSEKENLRITGATVDVAIISYANWRSSEGDGTPEKPGKWGVDEIVNGTDKKVAKKARWRQDLTAIVIDGVGQKYGGFISAAPAHVKEVVAKLREWQAANEAKPTFDQLCETCENEAQVIEAIKAGNVRVAPQFTMLENFVEVPAKPRKERTKKAAETTDETPAVTTA